MRATTASASAAASRSTPGPRAIQRRFCACRRSSAGSERKRARSGAASIGCTAPSFRNRRPLPQACSTTAEQRRQQRTALRERSITPPKAKAPVAPAKSEMAIGTGAIDIALPPANASERAQTASAASSAPTNKTPQPAAAPTAPKRRSIRGRISLASHALHRTVDTCSGCMIARRRCITATATHFIRAAEILHQTEKIRGGRQRSARDISARGATTTRLRVDANSGAVRRANLATPLMPPPASFRKLG